MIHVWYSAMLTREHCLLINRIARPVVSEVVNKIRNRKTDTILAKTVHIASSSIRLLLEKSHWLKLLELQDRNLERRQTMSSRHDILFHRIDHLHRDLFSKRPYERVAQWEFRDTGIMRPFGAALTDFVMPNP